MLLKKRDLKDCNCFLHHKIFVTDKINVVAFVPKKKKNKILKTDIKNTRG